jgi:hypothetical protein
VDGITVKSHTPPSSAIREFHAEATLKAPLEEVQSALLDVEAHASFMPYVVEAKDLGAVSAGEARLAHSRLEFPLARSRDFILRITVERTQHPVGRLVGAFRSGGAGPGSGDKHEILAK